MAEGTQEEAATVVRELNEARPVVAAGAVVWRRGGVGVEICLIHRPRYDDWTLPKGKVHPGEHVLACAVREVEEETGYAVRLGPALPDQRYVVDGRPKVVHYWNAHLRGEHHRRQPFTHEVDRVEFVPLAEAPCRLTYRRDAEVVAAFSGDPAPTTPLVVLRHTAAVAREDWHGPDDQRPLTAAGAVDAQRLAAPLEALGLTRVVSSDAVRCTDTVRPYAAAQGLAIMLESALSENGHATRPGRLPTLVQKLVATGEPTLVCSHRPVLPDLLAAAIADAAVTVPDEPLPPGGFHVVHYSAESVVAVETHRV